MSAATIDPDPIQTEDDSVEDVAVEDVSPPASYWVREFNFGEEDMEVNTLFFVHKLNADSVDPNKIAMNFHIPSGTLVLDAEGIEYDAGIWESFFAIENMIEESSDESEEEE